MSQKPLNDNDYEESITDQKIMAKGNKLRKMTFQLTKCRNKMQLLRRTNQK